jgi:hypothetical protein
MAVTDMREPPFQTIHRLREYYIAPFREDHTYNISLITPNKKVRHGCVVVQGCSTYIKYIPHLLRDSLHETLWSAHSTYPALLFTFFVFGLYDTS